MKVVSYQIGVDVLGFPVFVQHTIAKGETRQSKFYPKPKPWIKVIQKFIKQH
jgi:hypothetical protein